MTRRPGRRGLRAALIAIAATTGVTALALSTHTGSRAGITAAAALLGLTLAALAIELRLRAPRRPAAPLDDAYYAQPLRRRVLAALLGVRYQPTRDDEPRAYRHHDRNHDEK